MSSHISVVGTVATRPNRFSGAGRATLCSFRLAANERRYNRETQQWEDGETNWFTVVSFRSLADHAEQSFAVGDRILVAGRLRVRPWSNGEKSGTSVEIEADAMGHDLRWGVSSFRKHRSGDAASAGATPDTAASFPEAAGNEEPGGAESSGPPRAFPEDGSGRWAGGAESQDPPEPGAADPLSKDGFTPAAA